MPHRCGSLLLLLLVAWSRHLAFACCPRDQECSLWGCGGGDGGCVCQRSLCCCCLRCWCRCGVCCGDVEGGGRCGCCLCGYCQCRRWQRSHCAVPGGTLMPMGSREPSARAGTGHVRAGLWPASRDSCHWCRCHCCCSCCRRCCHGFSSSVGGCPAKRSVSVHKHYICSLQGLSFCVI